MHFVFVVVNMVNRRSIFVIEFNTEFVHKCGDELSVHIGATEEDVTTRGDKVDQRGGRETFDGCGEGWREGGRERGGRERESEKGREGLDEMWREERRGMG